MTLWCPGCGIVRLLRVFRVLGTPVYPWCRHGDPRLKARRMEPLPIWHPCAVKDGS